LFQLPLHEDAFFENTSAAAKLLKCFVITCSEVFIKDIPIGNNHSYLVTFVGTFTSNMAVVRVKILPRRKC